MARILNLIIIVLEIVGLRRALKDRSVKQLFLYYTQLSNLLTLVASLLLVIFGIKGWVEVLRYLSVSMLVMTFFVTAFILVPMSRKPKELLFSGNGLFHHLIIPVLSTISYMFLENRAPFKWIWLPGLVTLVYGIIMLYLNYTEQVKGPYPFFWVKKNGWVATVIWMIALLTAVTLISGLVGYHRPQKSHVQFIYVHGLSGWGHYDIANEFVPYWGLTGGDVIRYMNEQGYESYAASVDPKGSAWDRACELYAQLTGTKVDYGAAHSAAAGHERFGRDYSKEPLMKDFGDSEFVLIGHSFGGATIRLFSEILRDGSEEERQYTDPADLSPFFEGGHGEKMLALVTLAAPTNGTTAYDLYEDESFDVSAIEIPEEYEKSGDMVSKGTKATMDGRADWDYAAFDMHIDNAQAMNKGITSFDDVYYFAYPCDSTYVDADGVLTPDPEITEDMFMRSGIRMSRYTGTTAGGFVVDESWMPNDGLVNEVSARAPIGAPSVDYSDGQKLRPGVWTVMPTTRGDHMCLQGGFSKRVNVKPFYLNLAKMLAEL